MSEWVKTKLGTVLGPDGYIRGPFGSSLLRDELLTQGIPVYEQQHAIYNHRNFRFYIDDQKHKELKRFTVKENDLIVSCSGTLGKVSIIKKDDPKGIISQALLILRPHVNNIDIKYLYFFLISPIGFHSIVSVSSGSVQTNIAKRSIIENTDMLLPPLPEQRAIADVLSSLDDKIDLLQRQNKTLEGMVEAIYRRFFIDNRKAIWQECTVSEFADHEKTSIHPNRNPDTIFYHYSIPAFDETHMPVHELGAFIQSNKYRVIKNTILFSKLNPHKDKRIWLIPSSIGENSVCSTEFQVMNPKAEKYLLFLYGFISHSENYDEIAAGVGGTSGSHQRIDPEVIFKFKCFLPDDSILTNYNEMVEPIFAKIHHNRESMQALINQRDLLLPKLMSGEVRVRV